MTDKIIQLSSQAVCVPGLLKAGGRGAILFYFFKLPSMCEFLFSNFVVVCPLSFGH